MVSISKYTASHFIIPVAVCVLFEYTKLQHLIDISHPSRYDNHREQILRGSQTDYEDKSLDVFQYFTASCYRGFEDNANGFYAVYGKIFEKIAVEDIEFMESDSEFKSIPLFGKSTSEFDTVVGPFYAYWQSYCTKKSYSWLCPHNVTEIRDRRFLREIEKETKKIAQKARRERNEEIRALVAFVRKRDKRVMEQKKVLEERAEQNRLKQQEKRLEQLRKNREDVADMQKQQSKTFCTDGHEEKLRQMEEIYASTDDDYSDEYSNYNGSDIGGIGHDAEQIDFDDADTSGPVANPLSHLGYCIACDKSFKNQKSFRNHLSSKRHIENQKIHETLMNPISEVNGSTKGNEHSDSDTHDSDAEVNPPTEDIESKRQKSTRTKSKKKGKTITVQQLESDSEKEDELSDLLQKNSDDDADGWSDGGKKSKKSTKGKKAAKSEKPKPSKKSDKQIDAAEERSSEVVADKPNVQVPVEKSVDVNLTCVKCKSTYGSKNKLFNHLKTTGHGVYIDKTNPDGTASASNGQQPQKRIKKKQFYSKVTL